MEVSPSLLLYNLSEFLYIAPHNIDEIFISFYLGSGCIQ